MKKTLLLFLLFICFGCNNISKQYTVKQQYDVIFTQCKNTIEYHNVNKPYLVGDYIVFTTCDSTKVYLSNGAIEVIPINYE